MLTAGIHIISADEYHADPCPEPSLSSSIAKVLLNQSPLHAWTESRRLNPDWQPRESRVFDIGRAAHRAVLGRGGDYVAYPPEMLASNGAASTKEAKAWEAEQRAAGRTPLKADQVDAVGAMAKRLRHAVAGIGMVLDPDRSELCAISRIDDVWCRAMVDNAPEADVPGLGKVLVDFKTCEDASPTACRRAVENYSYDMQWAHYRDTWEAATGERRAFLFTFQEKRPPFEVGFVHLLANPGHSEDWSQDATDKIASARKTWGECLRSGAWPGYPRLIYQIGAQPFYRQQWQDKCHRAAVARSYDQSTIQAAMAWQAPQ
jgi:hypothetical protein